MYPAMPTCELSFIFSPTKTKKEKWYCAETMKNQQHFLQTPRPENWKTPSPALKALIIKHLQTADPRKRKTLAWQNVLVFFSYLRFPYELLSAIISPYSCWYTAETVIKISHFIAIVVYVRKHKELNIKYQKYTITNCSPSFVSLLSIT